MLWSVTLQLLLCVVHNRDVTVTSTVIIMIMMTTLSRRCTQCTCHVHVILCAYSAYNAAMAEGALHITTTPHLPHYNAMQLHYAGEDEKTERGASAGPL